MKFPINHTHTTHSRATRLLLWLLTLALMLPSLCCLPTLAAQPADTNYSNPSSPVVVELSASELTALLVGSSLPKIEKTYLDTMLGSHVFSYSDAIPVSYVTASYEGASLRINAKVYRYTAVNGTEVVWYPATATVAGKTMAMLSTKDPDVYSALFSSLDVSVQSSVKVNYSTYISIPSSVADYYRNYTYNVAYALWRENRTYEQYLSALSAYNTYLRAMEKYNADLLAWESYVVEKEKYDIKYAAYLQYLTDYELYEEKLKDYEAYERALKDYHTQLDAYEKYLSDLASYDQRYREYQLYLAQLEQAKAVLAVMDSLYVTSSDGKQLYATLMGGTVDMVLEPDNQKLLIANGVSPSMIAQADSATTALKTMLTEYAEKTSVADKLAYYQAHYTEIRDNIISLYSALHTFIDPKKTTVANAIMLVAEERGKLDRYVQMVAQLYVACTGLDDSFARDESWSIVARYTKPVRFVSYAYTDLLEECQLPADNNNADPSALAPLGEAVTEPVYPDAIEKPTQPTPVSLPIAPDVVLQPTAPTYIKKPTQPATVSHPGTAPATPSFTATEDKLIDAIENMVLRRRSTGTQSIVSLQTDVSITAAAAQMSVVTFYDYDGKTVLYEYTLPQGETIAYGGAAPAREASAKYTYDFAGWKTADGTSVDTFGVADASNIAYYAAYDATLRHYTVTFVVDGTRTQQTVAYGELPTYDGTPTKAQDAQNTYAFANWSPSLAPVSGDVTYEAVFRSTQRQYIVTWVVDGVTTTESYAYGETPTYKGSLQKPLDANYSYTFRAWDTTPAEVTGDATYTAQFDAAALLPDAQGTPLDVTDTGSTYVSAIPTDTVQIEHLVALALAQDRTVELKFDQGSATLLLNEALLTDLKQQGCLRISLQVSDETPYTLQLTCQGAQGSITPTYPLTILTDCNTAASAATRVYQIDGDNITELPATYDASANAISVKCAGNVRLQFQNEYTLTLATPEQGQQSALITLPARQAAGEQVTLTPRYEDGYRLDVLTVVGESGTEYSLTASEDGKNYTFVMPEENVTIRSLLVLQEYTIRFVVDGVEILSAKYHKGDTVILPETPTKEQQDNVVFTFSNWSPAVTTVTGDATYTAVFTSAPLGNAGVYIPDPGDGFNYLLFFGILFLVLLTGGIVLLVWRRKKKRAAAAPNDSTHAKTQKANPASTTAKRSFSATLAALLTASKALLRKLAPLLTASKALLRKLGGLLKKGWLALLAALVALGAMIKAVYHKVTKDAMFDVDDMADAATGTVRFKSAHTHKSTKREHRPAFEDDDDDVIDFSAFDAYEEEERKKRHHRHETLDEEEDDIHFNDEE